MSKDELMLVISIPAPLELLGPVMEALAGVVRYSDEIESTVEFDDPEILVVRFRRK